MNSTTECLEQRLAPRTELPSSRFSRLWSRLEAWRERARQRRELRTLSDRLLKDIGTTRAHVEYEAKKAFWRD